MKTLPGWNIDRMHALRNQRWDQRGITGLETAIVLIAFVVVASVFAFAVLTTGLISSEKAKETALGGLEETGGTIALRGSVVAIATTSLASIDTIKFQLSNATQAGSAVEMSSQGAVVSYHDPYQQVNLDYTTSVTTTPGWGTTWLIGSGDLLQPGERVEIIVNLTGLTTSLGANTEFTVEVAPSVGAVLAVKKKTPLELTLANDLK